jgi:hypothetical protein
VLGSNKFHSQLAPNDTGCTPETFDRGASVLQVKQPVDLGAAGLHQLGHALFGDPPLLHFVRELMRDQFRIESG